MSRLDQSIAWLKQRITIDDIQEEYIRFVMEEYAKKQLEESKEVKLLPFARCIFCGSDNLTEQHDLNKIKIICENCGMSWNG